MSPRRNAVSMTRCAMRFTGAPTNQFRALFLLKSNRVLSGQGAMVESRGFVGRRRSSMVKLPPGQYLTPDFPVLSAGPTPDVPIEQWEFAIDDGRHVLRRWSWQ